MTTLEALKPGLKINGILPEQAVAVVDVTWHGAAAVDLVYRRADGQIGSQLLFREDEANLEIVQATRTWQFNAGGHLFKLVAEAYRIHLAHLFDPVLAVHTSLIEPLPQQITAVYGEMLTRQPLRYLLADDPGAGKTIMAGLLIKELMVRGDVRRCLICVPGNLAPQWQDELWFKFQTRFEIITRETVQNAVSGNPFQEKELIIIRLDQIARDEALKEKLARTEWDLVIVDEAHKMSAHFWASELEETKRYKLGKLLASLTRHFLLMTATPHNGKEEDFQLFLALLDQDRFEGRFREGVHQVDISDLMRRMIKEDLRRFDGRPLFPERRAYTVSYPLSAGESRLYNAVTDYVREEFNRADALDDKRRGTVGFALTILQRRLASSPEAIHQSLKRRRERLETRLGEVKAGQRQLGTQSLPSHPLPGPPPPGEGVLAPPIGRLGGGPPTGRPKEGLGGGQPFPYLDEEELADLEDAPAEELEIIEEEVMDNATAAMTIAELEAEIKTLKKLEMMAYWVRHGGQDRKWEELAAIIQDAERMIDSNGRRRKLVIFTEHRDTLTYLKERINTLFGRDEVLVVIDGSVPREQRRIVEDRFRNDPDVYFLLATDAAGEGINLQRAHLMINYDLPWNPNRLEQRFGRIHRIGQTEVCHLWNLVAGQTREGYVYERLLRKLEVESAALGGKVFDVLGDELFQQTPLRKLLLEAIRYGDRPEVRAKLEQAVDDVVDTERLQTLLEDRSLVTDSMDISQIMKVREEMERYAARRLQPYYIKSFFLQAFEMLGGSIHEREPGRYRISYVPARIRHRAKERATPVPVWERYDRVCFDKGLIHQASLPQADFICPGHPLLDTVIDLLLGQHRQTLRAGTVLVDETDPGQSLRVLFFLQQNIQDARAAAGGDKRIISREVHFMEIDEAGQVRAGGYAPYLDYRPATPEELDQLQPLLFPAAGAPSSPPPRFASPPLVQGRTGFSDKPGIEAELTQSPSPQPSPRGRGSKASPPAATEGRIEGGPHAWLSGESLEQQVRDYAIEHFTPRHLQQVKARREQLIDKTLAAVHERLTKEINYWDKRAAELRQQEKDGKVNVRLNADLAQRRADDLSARLERRKEELAQERQISATAPVVIGGALIVPLGLLLGEQTPPELLDRRITEAMAMQAVMQAETMLGNHPRDVSSDNPGYDIESRDPVTGHLRFIEVKGRRAGAETVTVTHNEIMRGFNSPEQFILAIVEVADGQAQPPRYVRNPFEREPDAYAASVNYKVQELLARSEPPG